MIARRILEYFKWIEGVRAPLLAGLVYRVTTRLDNFLINRERIPANPLNTEMRDKKIIVSLTSFPARIKYVHLAIKSLMLQTCKPDRIILWLAESQFPDKQLPQQLTDLQQFGLEIKWCEDLYGHKKYLYCVKEQRDNEVVITYDDDIIYPPDSIKRQYLTHLLFPGCLVCERAQAIKYKQDGSLENPGRWDAISNVGVNRSSFSLNPSPGGGCLIPYGAFSKDATDIEKINRLAYKNDDLWYMFMAAENGTKTIKTRKWHRIFTPIIGSQIVSMAAENVVGGKNFEIMERLRCEYPLAYQRITGESK